MYMYVKMGTIMDKSHVRALDTYMHVLLCSNHVKNIVHVVFSSTFIAIFGF